MNKTTYDFLFATTSYSIDDVPILNSTVYYCENCSNTTTELGPCAFCGSPYKSEVKKILDLIPINDEFIENYCIPVDPVVKKSFIDKLRSLFV